VRAAHVLEKVQKTRSRYTKKERSSSSRTVRRIASIASPHLTFVRLRLDVLPKIISAMRSLRQALVSRSDPCDHFHRKESASPSGRKSGDALPFPVMHLAGAKIKRLRSCHCKKRIKRSVLVDLLLTFHF
jgi:hypothetical protein